MPKIIQYAKSTRGSGIVLEPKTNRYDKVFNATLREYKELHEQEFGYKPADATMLQDGLLTSNPFFRALYKANKGKEPTNVIRTRPTTQREYRQYVDGIKGTKATRIR